MAQSNKLLLGDNGYREGTPRLKGKRHFGGFETVIGALAITTFFSLLLFISLWANDTVPSLPKVTASDDMKLQIIIPSFVGSFHFPYSFRPSADKSESPHFPLLLDMLHSMACLVSDIETIDVAIILSSTNEVNELRKLLDDSSVTKNCASDYLNYNTSPATHLRHPPRITLHNLYDIAPPSIQNITNPEDTTDLLRFKKYKYQSVKKLAAAAYFNYNYAILLDSEGFVLRPVAFKEMVRQWASGPVIWYETWPVGSPLRSDWIVAINEACAHTLGRTMENFGVSMTFWEG
jgi:hypothetical protein